MRRVTFTTAMFAYCLVAAIGTNAADQTAEKETIREAVKSYVASFNRHDAKALAALWLPNAVYTNPLSGEQVVGREAIEKQFASIFADETSLKLQATTNSIEFVSPSVAIEQGSARLIGTDDNAEQTVYSAVYVKHDGKWLLDRVTEENVPVVASHYEKLKALDWIIGSWVDQDDNSRVETTYQWSKNQNFITSFFTVSVSNRIDMAGMQIIGWDPASKHIRSWVFDSGGGFGEGTWSREGNRWNIHAKGTLSDGSKTASINIITHVDDNTLTWQSVNRVVGDELLPNVDEVVVVRQTASQ